MATKSAAPRKDPKGGLTAAGRAYFKKKQGSNLKPGVKKPMSEMTPEEMKRKGSWATRFYGRKGKLPPLKDKDGNPTRYCCVGRTCSKDDHCRPQDRREGATAPGTGTEEQSQKLIRPQAIRPEERRR